MAQGNLHVAVATHRETLSTASVQPAFPDLLARARGLAVDFARTAEVHDRKAEVPRENLQALARAGLLNLVIPKSAGGLGFGLTEALQVVGAVAEGEPSSALILAMHYLQHGILADLPISPRLVDQIRKDSVTGDALINALRVEPDLGTPARGGIPATKLSQRNGC